MKMKTLFSALAAAFLSLVSANAQMSKDAIMQYVAEGVAAGKSKTEIGNELLARGLTMEQARQILNAYKSSSALMPSSIPNKDAVMTSTSTIKDKNDNRYYPEAVTDDDHISKKLDKELNNKTSRKENPIFGQDIFSIKGISFEPNLNMATPGSYILGPGDELQIDVWGENEVTLNEKITADGKIHISQVGPVFLSGLTIDQATGKLRKALSSKYALSGNNPASSISVTLANVRTIQVHVMGEVKIPGTYRLSSLSTLFHAVYRAGGVSEIGSLRNIRLVRNGKTVCNADLYKLIFDGIDRSNASLKDGDVVIVDSIRALVTVSGGVKRPMRYETTGEESVQQLIRYAGGFSSDAYLDEVTVERQDGTSGFVFTVKTSDISSLKIQDGDKITAYTNNNTDVFKNRVQVTGNVVRPGVYALGGEIATVRQLVEHAGGLLDDAFLTRATLFREKADRSRESKAVAIGAIMSGDAEDVLLRKGDSLFVANANEMTDRGNLTIGGYVKNPGVYDYADEMSVEDLILLAGGLVDGAQSALVEVSRRIEDFDRSEAGDTLAAVFSFRISEGLAIDGGSEFVLHPFDVVSVRRSPVYREQKMAHISGEVNFPGPYTLITNNDRLSDLYRRANGATPHAYIEGATLRRKLTLEARLVRGNMVKMLRKGGETADSLMVNRINNSDTYTIGINLKAAIENPGSIDDMILQEGDELIIPTNPHTVNIQGEVLYPNSVHYVEGKNVKYYIRQAGGYSTKARRAQVYVVYMNGSVGVGNSAKILPGCEVVVPARDDSRRLTAGEWIGIGSSATSLATMVLSVVNLVASSK